VIKSQLSKFLTVKSVSLKIVAIKRRFYIILMKENPLIVLTETSELAMYGKFNLFGTNCTDIIYVSQFPYGLIGQLFVSIKCGCDKDAELSLIDSTISEPKIIAKIKNGSGTETSIFKVPMKLRIVNNCKIEFVCKTNLANESRAYSIEEGTAPRKLKKNFFQESGIVEHTIKDLILDIITSASSEILIHDTYFDVENLIDLFSGISQEVKVKIITGPKFLKSVKHINDAIEIKSSLMGHDRFICLDGDEVYIFGYSFKEVVGKPKRISYYTRIYNKFDIDGFKELFFNIWNNP